MQCSEITLYIEKQDLPRTQRSKRNRRCRRDKPVDHSRTVGDASVPSPHPHHPHPYETNTLSCSFHNIPNLESTTPAPTGGELGSYLVKARRRYFSRDSNQASSERPSFSRKASGVTPAFSCRTAKVSRNNCRVTRFCILAAFTALPRI